MLARTLVFLIALAPAVCAQPHRVMRLEIVADLWSRMYLFQPRIMSEGLDWDKVLTDAIPAVERAGNLGDFVSVLDKFFVRR